MCRRISACWRKPQQQQMLEQIRRDVLLEAANAAGRARLGRALTAIIPHLQRFRLSERAERGDPRARRHRRNGSDAAGGIEAAMAQLSPALGIEPEDTLEAVEAAIIGRSASAVAATGLRRQRSARQERPDDKRRPTACRTPQRRRGSTRLQRLSASIFHRQDGASAQTCHHQGDRQKASRAWRSVF